jgi:putative transposase
MGRAPRIDVGGEMYHVLNRGNNRAAIFHSAREYGNFERILFEKLEEVGVVCHAYTIMPNHWHLLVKTYEDGALAQFMQRLTQTHTQTVRAQTGTVGGGHVYQGRYKSRVVDTDNYFLGALKYIERNPIRAKLCKKVDEWKWGSAYHRLRKSTRCSILNADLPMDLPKKYEAWIHEPTSASELDDIRKAVGKWV